MTRIKAIEVNVSTGERKEILCTPEEEAELDSRESETAAAVFPNAKASALIQIDTDTDAINTAVMGSRAQEYELAEQHAQEYKAAGYTGTVPSSVQSWATAKSWTATQAADDIVATAGGWRAAQAAIRAARLLRKEQVRNAADTAGITTAMTAWAGFVAYMRGQLGV